jgi:hypothetical protein
MAQQAPADRVLWMLSHPLLELGNQCRDLGGLRITRRGGVGGEFGMRMPAQSGLAKEKIKTDRRQRQHEHCRNQNGGSSLPRSCLQLRLSGDL